MNIYNRAILQFLFFFTERKIFIVLFLYFNINIYAQITVSGNTEIYIKNEAFVYSEQKTLVAAEQNTGKLLNQQINNTSNFPKRVNKKKLVLRKDKNKKEIISNETNTGAMPKIYSKGSTDSFVSPFGKPQVYITTNQNPNKSADICNVFRIAFIAFYFNKTIIGNSGDTRKLIDENNQEIRPPPFI